MTAATAEIRQQPAGMNDAASSCAAIPRTLHLACRMAVVCACLLIGAGPSVAQDSDGSAPSGDSASSDDSAPSDPVTFERMPVQQVRDEVLKWLASTSADAVLLDQQKQIWESSETLTQMSAEEILDLTVESFATADPAVRQLLQGSYGTGPVDEPVYEGIRSAPFFRNQVQLFRGRWLVQHRFYDEAGPILSKLKPDDVVDPAGLLFYRALCQSELLQKKEALDSLSLLLNNTLDVPDRFRIVAELLHKDLSARGDKGLDKVAQLMKDVERRLDLGRSGEKTQDQEDAVIAAFDQLLEEMDQQNQQQNGGGGGGSSQQNQPGNQGAADSVIKGSPAEGIADRKELKENGKWGMMDSKAEAKARELIRQKFPPNFLDQIGRYTRKLAEQKN